MYRLATIGLFLISTQAFSQNAKWQSWETEADTLLHRGEFKEAIKLYTKIIDASKLKDRTTYGALYKRAVSFYSLGEFDNALKDLDRFIPEYPQVPQARLLRALVHKELGNTEQQLSELDEALKGQPSNVELLKWRAAIYLEEAKYELARKDAELAKLLQDDAEIEMYLGVAKYNLGETDSALLCVNEAIALDATYVPAYLYGGTFCLEQEQFEKAIEYVNLALRLEPKNGMALFYKGIALIELEKTDEGCTCLRKAFYLDVDDASDYLTEYCFGIEK